MWKFFRAELATYEAKEGSSGRLTIALINDVAMTILYIYLLCSETMPHRTVSARNVTLKSVIFDTFNAIPGLEELRLSDGTFQGFLEGIKEEETLVPKLSVSSFWIPGGAIIVWMDESRW